MRSEIERRLAQREYAQLHKQSQRLTQFLGLVQYVVHDSSKLYGVRKEVNEELIKIHARMRVVKRLRKY